MKTKILMVLALSLGVSLAQAQEPGRSSIREDLVNNTNKQSQVGAGIVVGSLSGLNLDYWLTNTTSLDFQLAAENNNTVFGLSHLWYAPHAFSAQRGDAFVDALQPFAGAGILLANGTYSDYFNRPYTQNFAMGVQVPLGVSFLPPAQRFGVSADIAPTIGLTPAVNVFFTAELAAKFYF